MQQVKLVDLVVDRKVVQQEQPLAVLQVLAVKVIQVVQVQQIMLLTDHLVAVVVQEQRAEMEQLPQAEILDQVE
jgi:hypothetical protein